jgi:hypothetical protein
MITNYGESVLFAAAQEHYEQPIIATGTLKLVEKGTIYETRNIKGLGHRDHSWGVRDWVQFDGWNWVSAQFEEMTINFVKSHLFGVSPQMGVIYSKGKENIIIKDIEVTTITKEDGKTPSSSTFVLTDEDGNKKILKSNTISNLYLPIPTLNGLMEVYEQVTTFTYGNKIGYGISEYLTKN